MAIENVGVEILTRAFQWLMTRWKTVILVLVIGSLVGTIVFFRSKNQRLTLEVVSAKQEIQSLRFEKESKDLEKRLSEVEKERDALRSQVQKQLAALEVIQAAREKVSQEIETDVKSAANLSLDDLIFRGKQALHAITKVTSKPAVPPPKKRQTEREEREH